MGGKYFGNSPPSPTIRDLRVEDKFFVDVLSMRVVTGNKCFTCPYGYIGFIAVAIGRVV